MSAPATAPATPPELPCREPGCATSAKYRIGKTEGAEFCEEHVVAAFRRMAPTLPLGRQRADYITPPRLRYLRFDRSYIRLGEKL